MIVFPHLQPKNVPCKYGKILSLAVYISWEEKKDLFTPWMHHTDKVEGF